MRLAAPQVPPLGDGLTFLRALWALDHALQRSSKRMRSDRGVTGPQRLVMRVIGRFPGIDARRLAQIFYLHPSTLTGILQRLERQGLLSRRRHPRDRRRAFLGLTEKGQRVAASTEGTVEEAASSVLATASPTQVAATLAVLQKLTDVLARGAGRRRASTPTAERAPGFAGSGRAG